MAQRFIIATRRTFASRRAGLTHSSLHRLWQLRLPHCLADVRIQRRAAQICRSPLKRRSLIGSLEESFELTFVFSEFEKFDHF